MTQNGGLLLMKRLFIFASAVVALVSLAGAVGYPAGYSAPRAGSSSSAAGAKARLEHGRYLVERVGLEYSVKLTAENVSEFLGVAKFRDTLAHEKSEVGLVTGLAWTEVGGSILSTEVTIVDGKGKLTLTGKLGDVMQESAQAAMSYVRSRAARLGLPR